MRGKRRSGQTAEEIAAWAVLNAAEAAREKAARQAKRVRRAYSDLLRALQVPLGELPEDRGLRIVTAIVTDRAALAVCEKALAKAPRGWDKVETSVEDDPPAREAAE